MYIFIDESGIHKQDGKSTSAFVYVGVEHLDKMDRAVLLAEKNLKIEMFHWSKQIWKIRQAFLEMLMKEDFEVKIFVFQNPFTREKMQHALQHLLVEKHIKKVIIDGKKSRQYIMYLKKVLRQAGIPVKKIRMGNDLAFPCLRVADLFAGVTRSYVENQDGQEVKNLYKIAKNKITTQLMDGQVPASLF